MLSKESSAGTIYFECALLSAFAFPASLSCGSAKPPKPSQLRPAHLTAPFLWDPRAATLNLSFSSLPTPCCVLTSLPPPLFSAAVFLCVPFYCDINLSNSKLRAKLPCPAGGPGSRPGLAARRWVGGSWGAAHPLGCWPPPSRGTGALGSSPFSTGRRWEQPALLCSSSCAEGMAGGCRGAARPGFGGGRRGASLGVVAPTRGREGGSARFLAARAAGRAAAPHKAGG